MGKKKQKLYNDDKIPHEMYPLYLKRANHDFEEQCKSCGYADRFEAYEDKRNWNYEMYEAYSRLIRTMNLAVGARKYYVEKGQTGYSAA